MQILADNGATPPSNAEITETLWNTIMTSANVGEVPWEGAEPTEADLEELRPHHAAREQVVTRASDCIPKGPVQIDVLVHHRGRTPVSKEHVNVALLRKLVANHATTAPPKWAAGDVPWRDAVNELLTTGSTSELFDAGWQFADSTKVRAPQSDVEVRTPRAVTFADDLSGVKIGTLVLYVAIVHQSDDPVALAALPLDQLTLNDHHVAVRSVEVSA